MSASWTRATWLLADAAANTTASVTANATWATTASTISAGGLSVFGDTMSGGPSGRIGFDGQYLDAATGLYDFRARDYDPATGSFTSADPVDAPVGMPYTTGYTYGFNNPWMFTDPSGRFPSPGRVPRPWDDLPDWMKVPLAVPIILGEVVIGVSGVGTVERIQAGDAAADDGASAWDVTQIMANPMYGPVANTFTAAEEFQAGRPGAAFLDAVSAFFGTALTAAGVRAGMGGLRGDTGVAAAAPGAEVAPRPCAAGSVGLEAAETAGSLRIVGSGFSASELGAAEALAGQGRNVVLREASGVGRTSDLLVDGVPYDVYTPTTGSLDRIVSSIASKGSQVNGGGVVLDLSKSSLSGVDASELLTRVQGVTPNISDIIILGG